MTADYPTHRLVVVDVDSGPVGVVVVGDDTSPDEGGEVDVDSLPESEVVDDDSAPGGETEDNVSASEGKAVLNDDSASEGVLVVDNGVVPCLLPHVVRVLLVLLLEKTCISVIQRCVAVMCTLCTPIYLTGVLGVHMCASGDTSGMPPL